MSTRHISRIARVADSQSDAERRRDRFFGWQCRLRQLAVRDEGGRPNPGMMPRLEIASDESVPDTIVVLIVHADSVESTDQLRHIHRSTHDPRTRYERALAHLRSGHYQHPTRFRDLLTARFDRGSSTPEALLRAGRCVLDFDHYNQRYRVPCRIDRLAEDDDAWQATWWHNALFSPRLTTHSIVLGFEADWGQAESDP
jgi:hypothetical protein